LWASTCHEIANVFDKQEMEAFLTRRNRFKISFTLSFFVPSTTPNWKQQVELDWFKKEVAHFKTIESPLR